MSEYTLRFDHLDGDTLVRPLTIRGESPGDLAQAVHRHARGYLGSRTVDIHYNQDALTGSVLRNQVTVGEFTLTETPDPPEPNAEAQLLHGYTLNDLHHIARSAVHANRWHNAADIQDRLDAAWHAIVEHLLTTTEPPTRGDLFWAGTRGSDQSVRQTGQAHGYNFTQPGTGSRPRFVAYWFDESAPTPSPENRVVDRHALAQIWPQLTPRQQEALTALAATEDYRLAAQHLGVTPGTFNVLISGARQRFLTWWHEGEAPSRPWGTDRRVGSRTAAIPAATKRRPATKAVLRRTGRPVHELVHGKASTYTNHACHCTPCTQAATDQARKKNRQNGATPRRRITVSQLDGIRVRRDAGETLTEIAADIGFSDTYLSRLLSGVRTPAPDPA